MYLHANIENCQHWLHGKLTFREFIWDCSFRDVYHLCWQRHFSSKLKQEEACYLDYWGNVFICTAVFQRRLTAQWEESQDFPHSMFLNLTNRHCSVFLRSVYFTLVSVLVWLCVQLFKRRGHIALCNYLSFHPAALVLLFLSTVFLSCTCVLVKRRLESQLRIYMYMAEKLSRRKLPLETRFLRLILYPDYWNQLTSESWLKPVI